MKRLDWVDALKGFAMVCVVIGHMPIQPELKTIIYAFHMPLFFILSGFSYGLSKKQLSWREFVTKKAKQLLVPYVLLSLLVLPLWVLNHKILYDVNNSIVRVIVGTLYANQAAISMISNAMWFLPFLFILSVVFYKLEHLCNKNQKQMALFVTLSLLVSIGLNFYDVRTQLPWHLQTMFSALVFFFLGYVFVTHKKIQAKVAAWDVMAVLLALVVCVVFVVENGKVSMHINNYHNIFLYYGNAIAISFLLISLFQHGQEKKWLVFIGRNTLVILAFHNAISWLFKRSFPLTRLMVNHNPLFMSGIILLCCVPLVYLINTYVPKAVGK